MIPVLWAVVLGVAVPTSFSVAPFRVGEGLKAEVGERAAGLLRDRLEWRTGSTVALVAAGQQPDRAPDGPAPKALGTDPLFVGWLEVDSPGIRVTVQVRAPGSGEVRGVLSAIAYQARGLDRAIDDVASRLVGGPRLPRRIGIFALDGDVGDVTRQAIHRELAVTPGAIAVDVSDSAEFDDVREWLDYLGLDALVFGTIEKRNDGVAATLSIDRRDRDVEQGVAGAIEVSSGAADAVGLGRALRDPILHACGVDRPSGDSKLVVAGDARAALARGIDEEGKKATEKALTAYIEATGKARAAGDRETEALAQNDIGLLLARSDDDGKAIEAMTRALTLWRECGDRRNEAATLGDLADVLHRRGKWEEAESRYASALRLWLTLENAREAGFTYEHLGGNHEDRGDAKVARDFYQRGIEILDSTRSAVDAARVRNRLAWLQATAKDETVWNLQAALSNIDRAITDTNRSNAHLFDTLAEIHAAGGDFVKAIEAEKNALALIDEKDGRRSGFLHRKEQFESELKQSKAK
ncbi:MAG: tetratricopeptide repeat protein [Planctomycetes bacterium]|nr:tetratricopeptide repeat protein [Planctomycetota bacterium]